MKDAKTDNSENAGWGLFFDLSASPQIPVVGDGGGDWRLEIGDWCGGQGRGFHVESRDVSICSAAYVLLLLEVDCRIPV